MDASLRVDRVTKRYGALRALDDVSLEIVPGEVYAILGENGAGKSTLMGVFAGFIRPDNGSILLDGKALSLGQSLEAKKAGIEMVHQHFTLVPAFTVAENLALFGVGGLYRRLDTAKAAVGSVALAGDLGWVLDPAARAGQLPVGAQQKVEILKALSADAKILVLDEPTAVLSPAEVDDLFAVLRRLKESGKTVVLIAHKLSEVMRIADRVAVLRKGKLVAEAAIADVTERQLAEWMVGGVPEGLQKRASSGSGVALEVKDLAVQGERGEQAVRGVSFCVSLGEILGIGGVDGNGQVELAQALARVRPFKGSVLWNGLALNEDLKLAYIPQDRQADGLALKMPVSDNLLIGGYSLKRLRFGPFLKPRSVLSWARGLVARFSVAVGSVQDPVGSLSGGNQQKVVVARNLDSTPELLVAVNPTRGLDIRATNYVHEQILKARDAGAAVVLFSTDLDELAALADRSVFMTGGTVVGRMEDALGGRT